MDFPKIKMNGKGICGIRIVIYPFKKAPPVQRAARNPHEEVFDGMVKGFSHVDRKNSSRSHLPPVRDRKD
jgi:hypothetical protein